MNNANEYMQLYPEIRKIDGEVLNTYPLVAFEGEIVSIDNAEILDEAVAHLASCPAIGFDTETKPNFTKGKKNKVALLQLSSSTKAYVLRINKFGLPQKLADILANPLIKKVGAATHDDVKVLRSARPFEPAGFVDLQTIAKRLGIEQLGLRSMAALVLGVKISKSQQLSNWESDTLIPSQLLYAATDAWICLEIYKKLEKEGYLDESS